jgi:CBS domain containing-hemolysin-like protein
MNIDIIEEIFSRAPKKESNTLISEIFTRASDGKKVSLADCSDEEFERFISTVFEVKQCVGGWSLDSRQAIIDQLEYLLEWIVE